MDPRTALETVLQADKTSMIEAWTGEPEALDVQLRQFDKEAELSRAMIEGYMQWLEETGADSDFEVIASESAVEYEIAEGVSLAGRIDARVRRIHDGALMHWDVKTCASFADLERQLPQSEQLLLYEILLRATNPTERNAGAAYTLIRKVKRSATAKPPFFARTEVRFNDHQIRSAWYRIMGTIEDIQRTETQLASQPEHPEMYVYPRPASDCHWSCEFFPVCGSLDDGSRAEDMLSSLYEVGDPMDRYADLTGGSESDGV